MEESAPVFRAGQTVGGYELVTRLAAGGMATVFVARKDDEPFAIKVIHEHLSQDWEAMRWFIDEALISVRIRHDNVVRVDELGEQDGLYYLAMEYVHGCSLAELMAALGRKGRRLDPWIAAWITSQVAEGLHAAHELRGEDDEVLGVIHRDISPQNVLLGHDGRVKIVDFGVAFAAGRAERTRQGEIRGKFRYMAPEQVVGRRDLDRRLDLFALGVVFWEMLTQRRLYADLDQGALMAAVREPDIERPRVHRDDIPPQLEGILLNCLAADRDERPHDADVLRSELEEALQSGPADPQRALSGLILEVLGKKLLSGAQSLPTELAAAIGVDQLEPTIPRAVRDDETGQVRIDKRPLEAPARDDLARDDLAPDDLGSEREASRRFETPPAEPSRSGINWGWLFATLLAVAGLAGGLYWLSLD